MKKFILVGFLVNLLDTNQREGFLQFLKSIPKNVGFVDVLDLGTIKKNFQDNVEILRFGIIGDKK